LEINKWLQQRYRFGKAKSFALKKKVLITITSI